MAPGPPPPYNPQHPPPGYQPWPGQQGAPGQPAPGMAPPVPPKQGMSTGVLIAIVVVVVVAVIVLIPALLYVMVTGVVDSPGPGPVHATLSLSAGQWSGGTDVVVITSVSTSTLDADSLTFQIVAPNGTIYFSGVAGQGVPVNGVTVTVTFNNGGSENPPRVGADDNIGITAVPATGVSMLHGTTFKVLQGTDVLGTCILP